MFPLAVLRYRRIHRDPVLQLEAAVRDYGLQEFPNLFCCHDLIGNRHSKLSALSSQLSAVSSQARQDLTDGRKLRAESYFSFFRARFSIIARISRPSELRLSAACCTIPISWPIAQYRLSPAGRVKLM